MAELQKAILREVSADEIQSEKGTPFSVQFNPTSLKLKLTNQSDGGRSRGRQSRQNNGQSSTVLSMDLVFDTADEGTVGAPVSVEKKTAEVEKFVQPQKESSKPPPLLRFEWNELIIVGIVESLDIDFDHFAANGAPLRAKVSLSIKQQEPKYAFLKEGKGKKDSGNTEKAGGAGGATSPGNGTNDKGNNGTGNNIDRSDTAMDGETAPEFLARQGLDPAAWRGLGVDLSAGLSLEAGVEVGFSAGLNASVGVGVSVGVSADVGVSLEASLGLSASAVLSASASATAEASAGLSTSSGGTVKSTTQQSTKINGDSAGLALSAAGGIQSAIETVKINETQSVVDEAQTAFGAQANIPKQITSSSLNSTIRTPLVSAKKPNAGNSLLIETSSTALLNASSQPKADPRSTSYGYGVPLRQLYAAALSQEQVRLCSRNKTGLRDDSGPIFRKQKTTSPWIALPQRDNTRALADQAESKRLRHPCDFVYHPCHCED